MSIKARADMNGASRPAQPSAEAWRKALEKQGAADCGVWFSRREISVLRDDLAEIIADPTVESVVPEADTGATRTVYGIHRLRPSFQRIATHARMVSAAEAVIREPVYLYQSKLNPKYPGSPGWDWHVDFQAWNRDDGMPEPRAVTFAVYLDDVADNAGPLKILDGSHKRFGSWEMAKSKPIGTGTGPGAWRTDFGVRLKYALPDDFVANLLSECPEQSFPGEAGSVMAFSLPQSTRLPKMHPAVGGLLPSSPIMRGRTGQCRKT